MKSLLRALITLILPVFLNATINLQAETLCRSDIGYKWKKDKEETDTAELLTSFEARGADEAAARASLANQVDREKVNAASECRRQHENLSSCVAGHLSALNDSMLRMGFSERKAIEAAVGTDCAARQGHCGEVTNSEAKCSEIITAKAASSSSSEAKGAKKDDKAKKK